MKSEDSFPDVTSSGNERKGEDAKVSLRSVRRHAKDSLDKLVKDGESGEDDVHRAEAELDKLTSKYTATVDDAVKAKESELLEV